MKKTSDILTSDEAAKIIGVSMPTIRQMDIPFWLVGRTARHRRYLRSDVVAYLKKQMAIRKAQDRH
jgi:excisionase family DNA binding protein